MRGGWLATPSTPLDHLSCGVLISVSIAHVLVHSVERKKNKHCGNSRYLRSEDRLLMITVDSPLCSVHYCRRHVEESTATEGYKMSEKKNKVISE